MTNQNNVEQFVVSQIKKQLGLSVTKKSEFTLDTHELDFVEVIMQIEKKFKIVLGDEECNKIKTVGQLINLTKKQTN